jgi:hypothetical protein
MEHPLEAKYGLTAYELLDALDKRFRAKVTLEGAVAEVQMEKHISALVGKEIESYETHDLDGVPDFSLKLPSRLKPLRAECKNVRDSKEAYREHGEIVAYKVETQKTRAATGDATSRFYDLEHYEILGVCLGKKTDDWTQFMFARVADLERHKKHEGKLATMQRVPLPASDLGVWFNDLGELLRTHYIE